LQHVQKGGTSWKIEKNAKKCFEKSSIVISAPRVISLTGGIEANYQVNSRGRE
jgi:hypothetical protein